MASNEQRSVEHPTDRERLTEFYAAFNHAVADCGDTDDLNAMLAADVRWTDATAGSRVDRTYNGIDAVLENVVLGPGRRADHLQALPERFVDANGTVVVAGAYVGTVDERNFDIAFTHVFGLRDGQIATCTADRDSTLEQRVFDA